MPTTLLDDAGSDLYNTGAEFSNLDFALTALSGYWPEGSVWRMEEQSGTYIVRIVDGRAIREDGAVMRKKRSKYEWVEGKIE